MDDHFKRQNKKQYGGAVQLGIKCQLTIGFFFWIAYVILAAQELLKEHDKEKMCIVTGKALKPTIYKDGSFYSVFDPHIYAIAILGLFLYAFLIINNKCANNLAICISYILLIWYNIVLPILVLYFQYHTYLVCSGHYLSQESEK